MLAGFPVVEFCHRSQREEQPCGNSHVVIRPVAVQACPLPCSRDSLPCLFAHLRSVRQVKVIDFNAVGGSTSPLLFSWSELPYRRLHGMQTIAAWPLQSMHLPCLAELAAQLL